MSRDLTDLCDDLAAIRGGLAHPHRGMAATAEDSLVPPADGIAELRRMAEVVGNQIVTDAVYNWYARLLLQNMTIEQAQKHLADLSASLPELAMDMPTEGSA